MNNAWVVGVACVLITLIIEPLINALIRWVRSFWGHFSGVYLAITSMPERSSEFIVEIVKCKHERNNLTGTIIGAYFLEFQDGIVKNPIPNNNRYKFQGTTEERLLVISYHSIFTGDVSSGTLTLQGDTTGNIFTGIWGGLEKGVIVSESCIWVKVDRKLFLQKNKELILDETRNILTLESNPWSKGLISETVLIKGRNNIGKSLLLHQSSESVIK